MRGSTSLASLLVVASILSWCSSGAFGGIKIANQTGRELKLFLKGEKDANYRPVIKVAPRTEIEIPVPAGRYYVVTQDPDDRWQYMGWQQYSNHKITYKISLCTVCSPKTDSKDTTASVQTGLPISQTLISHVEMFHCKKCGEYHAAWKPGWGRASNGTDDHSADVHTFDSYGVYRLGVSAVDADEGVMISDVDRPSPAHALRRIDGDDHDDYHLTPGFNTITHVNGKPVLDTNSFSEMLATAERRVVLTVKNTEREGSRIYWATLR